MAGALAVTTLIFALIYYVTPDVKQRAFRWLTPGALAGVLVWLVASLGFSAYISKVADVGALFGAFAGAIVLVGWLWLTNVALLFALSSTRSSSVRKNSAFKGAWGLLSDLSARRAACRRNLP